MQIEEFVSNYKAFCESKFGSRTGTATSYANAYSIGAKGHIGTAV